MASPAAPPWVVAVTHVLKRAVLSAPRTGKDGHHTDSFLKILALGCDDFILSIREI